MQNNNKYSITLNFYLNAFICGCLLFSSTVSLAQGLPASFNHPRSLHSAAAIHATAMVRSGTRMKADSNDTHQPALRGSALGAVSHVSQHTSLASSSEDKVLSNAYNFGSMYQGKVDARTGAYNMQLVLGQVVGHQGFGPHFTLAINYSSINRSNSGFGVGFALGLSRYNQDTQMLSFATGGTYKIDWNGTTPQIENYKLDNLHLTQPADNQYLLIATHKDGIKEYFNDFGLLVRIENTRGTSLYFHYAPNLSLGQLTSITNGSGAISTTNPALLSLVYTANTITVSSLNEYGKAVKTILDVNQGQLQSVVLPDGRSKVIFDYMNTTGAAQLLHEVDYPTGLKNTFDYTTLLVPTGGPIAQQYAVKTWTQYPGFGQPKLVTHYQYALHGHNYLGYAAGVQYRTDVDNLYLRADNYNYSTKVTAPTGISTVNTYNKYHLLYHQQTFSPLSPTHIIAEKNLTYPEWKGKTLAQLPANYSLPYQTTQTVYNVLSLPTTKINASIPINDSVTTDTQYDAQGNVLSTTDATGLQTIYHYQSSDTNGFINNVTLKQITPAIVKGQPPLSMRQVVTKYTSLPSLDQTLGAKLFLPNDETTAYQQGQVWVTVTHKTIDYAAVPKKADYSLSKRETLSGTSPSLLAQKSLITKHYTYAFAQPLIYAGNTFVTNSVHTQYNTTQPAKGLMDGQVPIVTSYSSVYNGRKLLTMNSKGDAIGYVYDALGRLTQVIANVNHPDIAIKQYDYQVSPRENSVILTLPNKYQTKQTYDGLGRVIATYVEHLDAQGTPEQGQWDIVSTTQYNAQGKVASKKAYDTDGQGQTLIDTTTYHYDALDRLSVMQSSDGQAQVKVYDPVLRRTIAYGLYADTSQPIATSSYCTIQGKAYACKATPLQVVDKNVAGKATDNYEVLVDPNGVGFSGKPLYSGTLKSDLSQQLSTLQQGQTLDSQWLLGWVRAVITQRAFYSDSHTVYDGYEQMVSEIDVDGNTTDYAYDGAGRLMKKVMPNGNTQTYHYDGMGQLSAVGVILNGKEVVLGSRDYNYTTGMPLLTTSTDVLGHAWTYHYDTDGNLTSYKTPTGHTIVYTYDDHGNVLSHHVNDDEQGQYTVQNTYDPKTNQLLTQQDATGMTTMTYYANGAIKGLTHTAAGGLKGRTTPAYSINYTYTLAGQPKTAVNGQGKIFAYHYNTLGQLSTVSYDGKVIAQYQYNSRAQVTHVLRADHIQTDYTYNSLDQLKTLTYTLTGKDKLQTLRTFSYTYQGDGNLRQRVQSQGQAVTTETYSYDSLNNLKSYQCHGTLCPRDVQGNSIQSQVYQFDGVNNIQAVQTAVTTAHGPATNTTTYHYNPEDPIQLTDYENSNSTYGQSHRLKYDTDGNVITDGDGNTLSYSAFDQVLALHSQANGTINYQYDGAGVQVSEQVIGQAPLYYLYGAAWLGACSASGAVGQLFVWGWTYRTNQSGW